MNVCSDATQRQASQITRAMARQRCGVWHRTHACLDRDDCVGADKNITLDLAARFLDGGGNSRRFRQRWYTVQSPTMENGPGLVAEPRPSLQSLDFCRQCLTYA